MQKSLKPLTRRTPLVSGASLLRTTVNVRSFRSIITPQGRRDIPQSGKSIVLRMAKPQIVVITKPPKMITALRRTQSPFGGSVLIGRMLQTSTAPPVATGYTMSLSTSSGVEGQSINVILTGNGVTSQLVTLGVSGITGLFVPSSINLNNTTPVVVQFTPLSIGDGNVSATNSGSLTNPADRPFTSVAPPSGITLIVIDITGGGRA